MRWSIRSAEPGDRESITNVVQAAFSNGERDGHEEVDILFDTWSLDAALEGLELVAVEDDQVFGHILAAHGHIDHREVVAVAPLCVAPSRQGRGAGTALMTELLHRAERTTAPLVVLLGDPEFYGRFGFELSGPLGIVYPPAGAGNPHFQVRKLTSYDPAYRGVFRYCWEERSDGAQHSVEIR